MTRIQSFEDRVEVGRKLAKRLERYGSESPVVVGIPRGGLPVAYEISAALGAPLDVLIVRKVGAPGNPEYGLGAVAEGGLRLINRSRAEVAGFSLDELEPYIVREEREVAGRVRRFRDGRPREDLNGRTVLLADDGIATGGTVLAGVEALRRAGVRRIVVGLGVSPPETAESLRPSVDDLEVLLTPPGFEAVGQWFRDFDSVHDSEVLRLLEKARSARRSTAPG